MAKQVVIPGRVYHHVPLPTRMSQEYNDVYGALAKETGADVNIDHGQSIRGRRRDLPDGSLWVAPQGWQMGWTPVANNYRRVAYPGHQGRASYAFVLQQPEGQLVLDQGIQKGLEPRRDLAWISRIGNTPLT